MAHSGLNIWLSNINQRRRSLSAQLLFLTSLLVIVAEIFLFIPSVAKFRYDWLDERIERAYLASLAFEVAPDNMVEPETVRQLYSTAEILGVRLEVAGRSQLVLGPDIETDPGFEYRVIDLRSNNWPKYVLDALSNIFSTDNAYLLVSGVPDAAPDVMIELFLEKQPLQQALWGYSLRVFLLSLAIAMFVAIGIYLCILSIFVRPMVKLTDNIRSFQEHPEDPRLMMIPSERDDEMGNAQRAVSEMQQEVRQALEQKARLATLGEGVAKINHDLRNILASAVLMSDRLAKSDDPRVQKLSPRLVQALDKAVALCRATLDYGRAGVQQVGEVNIFDLVEETSDALKSFAESENAIRFVNGTSPDHEIKGDQTQLFRAVFNLARNAAEVLVATDTSDPMITFSSREAGGAMEIDISDNGPGVPDDAQEHLFVPFKGSRRRGGSGLGLAIVAETVKAHGGDVSLATTGPTGSTFRISLPTSAY